MRTYFSCLQTRLCWKTRVSVQLHRSLRMIKTSFSKHTAYPTRNWASWARSLIPRGVSLYRKSLRCSKYKGITVEIGYPFVSVCKVYFMLVGLVVQWKRTCLKVFWISVLIYANYVNFVVLVRIEATSRIWFRPPKPGDPTFHMKTFRAMLWVCLKADSPRIWNGQGIDTGLCVR